MSLKVLEINPIFPTKTQNWTDLNRDGKRLDKVIKICYRRIIDSTEQSDPNVILGYINALNRTTHEKTNLVTTVLGVKQALEDYKKNNNNQ